MNTPKTDNIFGEVAIRSRRVGHGAKQLCEELERENIALREGMAALESMQTDPTASKIAKHYLGLYPANVGGEPPEGRRAP